MRPLRSAILLCCLALLCTTAFAQDSAAIQKVLDDQQSAWNRGDIDSFMYGYNNSPETTFIGKTVEHGYAGILARYKKTFSTRAAMGTLKFSDLIIKILGQNYAVVTGKFHLARTAAGGGDASGVFSLIFAREPQGWRIILDHTTS
ncbi:MAG TPA: nuclear transport factor 2 family protein [Silvibacterium sp.]|nr:nuclear transport factor 2 family protein [Silvibacterium sp.]